MSVVQNRKKHSKSWQRGRERQLPVVAQKEGQVVEEQRTLKTPPEKNGVQAALTLHLARLTTFNPQSTLLQN